MFVAARVSDHPRGMGLCGLLWTSTAFGVRRGLSVSLQATTTSVTEVVTIRVDIHSTPSIIVIPRPHQTILSLTR